MMADEQYIESSPSLQQMESAKNALLTFCMYYYQACRQAGYDLPTSKELVAKEILKLYEQYDEKSERKAVKPSATRLLETALAQTKGLGVEGKAIRNTLLDLQRVLKEA
jgi:thymidylate synthase ThyX